MSSLYFNNLSVFLDIYDRIAASIGSAKQKDIAAALGITAAHINNLLAVAKGKDIPKGPKTLPYKQLVNWAASNGVSLDWLLTGKEGPGGSGTEPAPLSGQAVIRLPRGDPKPLSEYHADLLEKTVVVLRASGDAAHFAQTLESTIDSMYRGVQNSNQVQQPGPSRAADSPRNKKAG